MIQSDLRKNYEKKRGLNSSALNDKHEKLY